MTSPVIVPVLWRGWVVVGDWGRWVTMDGVSGVGVVGRDSK